MRIIFLLALLANFVEAKVLIFTYVYNRPDFIELHVKTFDNFLKEPYEYVVFNDAPTDALRLQIEQMCRRLKVRCLRVPDHARNRQTASYRHMDGIKFSLRELGCAHTGPLIIVDADMFLIRPFSVIEYMKEYDFIGAYQYRPSDSALIIDTNFLTGFSFGDKLTKVEYPCPSLVFMNMARLPNKQTMNFDGDRVEGHPCDVGGHMYYYFKNNPSAKVHFYVAVSKDHLVTFPQSLEAYGFDKHTATFIKNTRREYGFEYHAGGYFIHFYAGGSNWPNYSRQFVKEKTDLLNEFIDNQVSYYANKVH